MAGHPAAPKSVTRWIDGGSVTGASRANSGPSGERTDSVTETPNGDGTPTDGADPQAAQPAPSTPSTAPTAAAVATPASSDRRVRVVSPASSGAHIDPSTVCGPATPPHE